MRSPHMPKLGTSKMIAAPIEVPAPSGQFRPLPADWLAKTLAYRVPGPSNIFVEHLQKIVMTQGEISIGIAEVQALAMTAAGASGWSLNHWTEIMHDLDTAAGGDWPLRVCLDERRLETLDGFAASRALISIDTEWRVLHHLVALGWHPIQIPRSANNSDWKVFREFPHLMSQRTIEVDAKFKGSRGSCGVLLKRFLYGAALIRHGDVHSFDWSWKVSDRCRDKDARQFADGLWNALPTLAQTLSQPLTPWVACPLPASNAAISVTREKDDKGQIVHVLRSIPGASINLTARPAQWGRGIFVIDDASGGTEETIDTPESITLFDKMFGSLGMNSQADARAARQTPCVFVVVWPMPPTMEVADRKNLPKIWQALSDANSWPPAVLWPTGFFEALTLGWLPNERASTLLR